MSKKILIYSNNEADYDMLKDTLSDHHDLILCETYEMGLEVLKNADIKGVIIKCRKPDNTINFAGKLKEIYPKLRTIAIVDAGEDGLVEALISKLVYKCIRKPLKADELLALCSDL